MTHDPQLTPFQSVRRMPAKEVYPSKTDRDYELSTWQEELLYRVSMSEETLHGRPLWVRRAIQWCLYLAGERERMP